MGPEIESKKKLDRCNLSGGVRIMRNNGIVLGASIPFQEKAKNAFRLRREYNGIHSLIDLSF